MNTDEYSIEVYKNLHKPSMIRNEEMMNWIAACDKNRDRAPASYILTYTSEPKDGKVEITLVAYRTGLNCVTDLAIIPTGAAGTLELQLRYSHDEDKMLDQKAGDINYNINYFRITADADVDFTYTVMSNGVVETLDPSKHVDARTEANGDTDPNFVLIGTLDTELVKYMYELNNKLVAKLDACQNIEELKALTAEIKLLLSSDPEFEPSPVVFTLLSDIVEEYKIDNTLADFHRNTLCITGYEQITIMVPDPNEPGKLIEGTYKDTVGNTEEYIYYVSPYAIYRSWMQTYGFLPK